MLDTFSLLTFTPLVQSRFQVHLDDDRPVDLQLIAAEDLGSTPTQERFSLLLSGPPDLFLPQGLYPLTHPRLGCFDLFLVPTRQGAEGFVYEAVFNRLI